LDQSLDAVVPRLLVGLRGEVFGAEALVSLEEGLGIDDLRRESGRSQNLGDEGVGIKSDGGNEALELIFGERSVGALRTLVVGLGSLGLSVRRRGVLSG